MGPANKSVLDVLLLAGSQKLFKTKIKNKKYSSFNKNKGKCQRTVEEEHQNKRSELDVKRHVYKIHESYNERCLHPGYVVSANHVDTCITLGEVA